MIRLNRDEAVTLAVLKNKDIVDMKDLAQLVNIASEAECKHDKKGRYGILRR